MLELNEQNFIQAIKNYKDIYKVAKIFGLNEPKTRNYSRSIGFDYTEYTVPRGKLTDKDKEYIIFQYNNKTSNELAKELNVSRGMITKIWHDNQLSGKEIKITPWFKDLTGQTFGNMLVLSKTDRRNAGGGIIWLCKCLKCNTIKEADGNSLQNGSIVSCGCIGKKNLELGRHQIDDKIGKRYGKLIVIEQDTQKSDNKGNIYWKCECDCGRETSVLASNLITGNTQSCGYCSLNSHGNLKIEKLLSEAKIPFVREYRFETCKDKRSLPFDFYVDNKYLIEYDGIQHYDANNSYHTDKVVEHDAIKSQWCKDSHIPLIRIPYTQYNELSLKDLLLESSNFIEK